MDKRTAKEIAELLKPLATATGREWAEDQIKLWTAVLQDLDYSAIHAAIGRYISTNENGFPMPASIRKLAIEHMQGSAIGWEDAVGRVLWAANRWGTWGQSEAKAHLTELEWRTVRNLGGWQAICDSPQSSRETLRSQFREAYKASAARIAERSAIPERLMPPEASRITREPIAIEATPEHGPPIKKLGIELRDIGQSIDHVELPSEDEIEKRRDRQIQAARAIVEARLKHDRPAASVPLPTPPQRLGDDRADAVGSGESSAAWEQTGGVDSTSGGDPKNASCKAQAVA